MRIDPRRTLAALVLSVACGAGWAGPVDPALDTEYLHITAVAPGYAGRPASDGRWFIYLQGYIDTGAAARLAQVLDKEHVESAVVYLDSPGGHIVEAMALGRIFRERRYATSVGTRAADGASPRAGRCFSACPIAYAGGLQRSLEPGSVLGIHRAENSVAVPDELAFQHAVSVQVTDYLKAMGVSAELVTIMSHVPHDAIRELSIDEDVRLRLVNAGETTQRD
jgi:hypothetical protein